MGYLYASISHCKILQSRLKCRENESHVSSWLVIRGLLTGDFIGTQAHSWNHEARKPAGTFFLVLRLAVAAAFALSLCLLMPQVQKAYAANTIEGNPLRVEIQYNEPVLTGQVTTFKLIGSGGDGNYQYKPVSLSVWHEGYYQQIVDFSYAQLKPVDTFDYTFTYSGQYEMKFQVFGKNPEDGMFAYNFGTTYFTIEDPSAPSLDDRKQQAEAKADEVWAQCQAAGCRTDYEKALWLHDWIIDNVEYDYSLTHYQEYDVFFEGQGTCEAYHAAYRALLKRAGIPCGSVNDSGHIWTSVQLGGKWYNVDTTHDDTTSYASVLGTADSRHLLFGVNDEILNATLAINGGAIQGKNPQVSATALDDNYLIKSGHIRTYSDPFVANVNANLKAGRMSFDITVPLASLAPSTQMLLYSVAAYDLSGRSWEANDKNYTVRATYNDGKISFVASEKPAVESIPMYRLYNHVTSEHFYTANAYERDVLVRGDWNYEGIGWYAPSSGAPVYRLYNPGLGDHHYTTNKSECDMLVRAAGWNYEGIGWYSGGTKPLYRQYNPGLKIGQHNYTANVGERDALAAYHGWQNEGIGWYGI